MAINRSANYTGRFFLPSVTSPQGKFKNRTAVDVLDGTYIDELWANDQDALIQSLLISNNTTLNGTPDEGGNSQAFQSLVEQAIGRASYCTENASSAPNAYVFDAPADGQPPESIFNGMVISGSTTNPNTGASSVNAFGFGVASLRNFDGSELAPGQMSGYFQAVYLFSNFRLITSNEFNSKYFGLQFNGLTNGTTLNADNIFRNSRFFYNGVISIVNPSGNFGVLETIMSTSTFSGGKQTWINTDELNGGDRFKNEWRRYLDSGGVWGAWENVTPIEMSEGEWFPTIQDASNSNAEGQSYSVQIGNYTRVGKRVTLSGWLNVANAGTLSGDLRIAGIPFPASVDPFGSAFSMTLTGGAITPGSSIVGEMRHQSNFISIKIYDQAGGVRNTDVTDLTPNFVIFIEGSYLTD